LVELLLIEEIAVAEREEKICPFLSAASGAELYLCDPGCMFYEDGACLIAEGLRSLREISNALKEFLEKR